MARRKRGDVDHVDLQEPEGEQPEQPEQPEHERPFVGMDIVDRPATGSKALWHVDREADAIIKTVQTPGKAVRLAFRNIEHIVRIQMALRGRVAKQGLVMRYKTDPENRLICWAERVPPKESKDRVADKAADKSADKEKKT